MMLDLETRLIRRPDLVAADMDGETVMIDIESGRYFGLVGIGPYLWTALEHECSVGGLIDDVRSHFAAGPDDPVEQDVRVFLGELVDKNLVETVDR